jgi:hypothetical protein
VLAAGESPGHLGHTDLRGPHDLPKNAEISVCEFRECHYYVDEPSHGAVGLVHVVYNTLQPRILLSPMRSA